MKLVVTDPAKEDLVAIWEYIRQENPKAAEKLMGGFPRKIYYAY